MTVRQRRTTSKQQQETTQSFETSSSRSSLKRQRRENKKSSLSVSTSTLQACAILGIAMVMGLFWNWLDGDSVDPNVGQFLKQICSADSVYCHPGLVPSRRTQKATRQIQSGETVLKIPRRLQIWDLDALRNEFVRRELFKARLDSDIALPSSAFLAAYLALLQHNTTTAPEIDPILEFYLNKILPKYEDYLVFHPILSIDLVESLGTYSSTYIHVTAFRQLLHDEYNAFASVSVNFTSQISLKDYLAARLNVMTRSFGTGELKNGNSLLASAEYSTWEAELAYYRETAGISLKHGSHAMIPVLDLYDHHAEPNVRFVYDAHKRAFVVSAVTSIAAGYEVMDSYGRRTDSNLFARYGFVNGDGSGWTQASLALWHTIDVQPENVSRRRTLSSKDRSLIVRYLQYDDGYENCMGPGDEAWEFKQLKFRHLLSVALEESRWEFRMSPRDKLSRPAASSNRPITLNAPPAFDMHNLQFDGNAVFETCRLLTLTHHDYGGNATAMLRQALEEDSSTSGTERTTKKSSILPPTRDALEYRTQLCIARMASTALSRFGVSIEQQQELVEQLNRKSFGKQNWTVAHLRLGEMQSLDMLKQVAFAGLRRVFGPDALSSVTKGQPAYAMRDVPCPPEYWHPLLELV